MINTRKFFIPLLIALNLSAMENIQEFNLATYDYKSAAVLPTFTRRNIKWAIISREAEGKPQKYGGKKYTYDSFSGGREKGDTDAALSAAREFHEEAILEEALGWSLEDTERFVNPDKTDNTWVVIARSKPKRIDSAQSKEAKNVIFLTDFTPHTTEFFNNFYEAREREVARYRELGVKKSHRHTTEKDRVAKVRWSDLREAIINQENSGDRVCVSARVMDPETKRFHRQMVTLRPILVLGLRPFLLNQPYEQGENEKIRHYTE